MGATYNSPTEATGGLHEHHFISIGFLSPEGYATLLPEALGVPSFHVRPIVKKTCRHFQVTSAASQDQSRVSLQSHCGGIGPPAEQELKDAKCARVASNAVSSFSPMISAA